MANITLSSEARDIAVHPKDLRKQKKIPSIMYGHGIENISLTLDHEAFRKVFKDAGSNTIIDLEVPGGKKHKVLVQDIQKDPVYDTFQHVDFLAVQMTEKLITEIPFEFTGESNAVKNFGGILVTNMDEVEVRCLPGDLVHSIIIDLSKLENIGDSIHLEDITIPKGLEVQSDMASMIVTVQAATEEKEEEAPAEVAMPEASAQKAPEAAAE